MLDVLVKGDLSHAVATILDSRVVSRTEELDVQNCRGERKEESLKKSNWEVLQESYRQNIFNTTTFSDPYWAPGSEEKDRKHGIGKLSLLMLFPLPHTLDQRNRGDEAARLQQAV
ncbi:hypothetical protein MATL_G00246070 [Megalops atlanticus]|uniref:Uncharacterized protein n=1 Tax=Megalops atlanticus TaxID=7932 RepID=A0A9D3PDY8_MEGAT|nr:hypothetical protein MATL_G00246070 [Megalops atlanticus]